MRVPLFGKCWLLNSTSTLLHSVPWKLIFVDSLLPLSQVYERNGSNSTLLHSPGEVYTDVRFSRSLFTFLRDFIILAPTYDENPTHKIFSVANLYMHRWICLQIYYQYICYSGNNCFSMWTLWYILEYWKKIWSAIYDRLRFTKCFWIKIWQPTKNKCTVTVAWCSDQTHWDSGITVNSYICLDFYFGPMLLVT